MNFDIILTLLSGVAGGMSAYCILAVLRSVRHTYKKLKEKKSSSEELRNKVEKQILEVEKMQHELESFKKYDTSNTQDDTEEAEVLQKKMDSIIKIYQDILKDSEKEL